MSKRGESRRGGRFRRVSGLLVIGIALTVVGGLYSLASPHRDAAQASTTPADVAEGKRLYEKSCISCHGRNLQGVTSRGPSLIGAGGAAVDFQVGTGRMPAARQEAQIGRKKPVFDDKQTRQIAAYVQAVGGGPEIPTNVTADGDLAQGGRLFRGNCASCHNFAGKGGALSSGKYAPSLDRATPTQIYEAMLTGPQNMPVFGDNQISPQEKADIITFVTSLRTEPDPGGFGLGRLGPVPEGLVGWLVGIGALVMVTLWIGVRS
ncbi:MAG: cytochrome c [Mycobacteriales bacterium]